MFQDLDGSHGLKEPHQPGSRSSEKASNYVVGELGFNLGADSGACAHSSTQCCFQTLPVCPSGTGNHTSTWRLECKARAFNLLCPHRAVRWGGVLVKRPTEAQCMEEAGCLEGQIGGSGRLTEVICQASETATGEVSREQPYREIFEFFIEDFKTYKPLLSSIKNAYEVMLAHQREKIRALEPLKAKLVTVNEDCNERILAMRAEERYEISMLKKEKMNLLKLIDKKNEEKISLQSEVTKLRKNLAEEYLHYLSERDARKILIADLNELRYQREDMSLAQYPGIWGEDPVKLTVALKMARQDLTRMQMELNTMKANFGDVVPRRDFEMQEKTNKDLQEQLDSLKDDYEEVRKEHEMLLQLHMSTLRERDQFYAELQEIQRTSTPRPDWSKCEDVVAGGQDRWHVLAEGKNSDQLVDVLLEEIGEGLLREKDFFPGLETARQSMLPSLQRKESVYIKQKETIAQLLKEMTHADSQNEGLLTMEQLSTVLRSTFPFKKDEKIQELMEAGGWHPSSSNADLVNYRLLFMEDEEGQSVPFLQKLWEQYLNEKDEYLYELKQELGLELHDKVTLPKLHEALMTIDPSLDKQTLNGYLSQAFQFPVTELPEEGEEKEEGTVIQLQTALEQLQMSDVRRMGPREQEPAT
ncbi:translin-associated factor X-interacting protein 1 isoform X4 [Camelus ferus]|uniref:Translin-associated factor X-interacting protein 1 isoform X4 n=1 Tax=Camelus ferus TaxID=419612 RepID=A0A8B8TJY3_CAMFR|nr:translin-associated factor X-interacting protein 1 isoform X4 [Camelus ferus]